MTELWNKGKKTIYVILFAILIPVSGYIFYGALDTLRYAGALQEILQGKLVPVFLLGTSFLFCILFLGLFRKVKPFVKARWGAAVPAAFAIMLAVQVVFVLTVRTSLRQDHLKIFDTAVSLLDGGTVADTHFKSYFMKYPNNIPMCLFTCGWLKLASAAGIPRTFWMDFIKLVNLAFMNVGLWCAFRLVCRYRSRRMGIGFLLLVMVNPLWYLLGQMYYTSTISLAFSMGGIALFDRARRADPGLGKYLSYFCVGILLAAGYEIRATVILTLVSLAVYGLLQVRKPRVSRGMLSALAVTAGFLLTVGAYGAAEKQYAGFDPGETGYPAVHWVMMSAQGEGQYNSTDDAYTGSFDTKEERSAADWQRLRERIADMGPGGLLTLFRNKMRVAFSDGTDDYYALFRTMQETSPLQAYINGGRSDYLALYLHSYHGMLTGMILLAFLWRAFRGGRSFLDVLAVNICGGYLFYLIWEVDQAYSIPFMLMLLVWAAEGIALLEADFRHLVRSLPPVDAVVAVGAGGAVLVLLGTVLAVGRARLPVRDYAVLQDQETSNLLTLNDSFSQTFRTDRAFDHVDLWVANWDGAANDSVYAVEILDESGATVAEGTIIGAEAPCMEAVSLSFSRVEPEREQTYTIRVSLQNPDCAIRTDFLYYQSAWDMYADGALYASPDGTQEESEQTGVDLAFAVYEE
ncbi:MAG: hypothetical protein Q4C82_00885 [Eubacteriales bacterium]|nr:hypothetical protein [Eubacteriales bacterium]